MIGTFAAVFDASYASLAPRTVHPHLLNQANGRLGASSAAASVIGPEGAGVLLAMTGSASCRRRSSAWSTPLGAAAGGVLASSFAIGPVTALACGGPLSGSLGLAWLAQLSAR